LNNNLPRDLDHFFSVENLITPRSVTQLAEKLKRTGEAVSRDISFLKAHRVAETERTWRLKTEVKPSHIK